MYLSRFALILAASAAALMAQTRPPAGSIPSSPSNPNIPGNNVPNSPGNFPSNRSPFPGDMPRPILLTGKVMIDDGTAPSEPVRIERVCLGQPHAEGFTDSKGRFTVTLGQEMDAMPDASEMPTPSQMGTSNPSGGIRESQLQNCELRALLPGFRSETVSLANRRYLDDPDVGTIYLHRVGNVEGLTLSATSALAPKDARKAYEKGLEAEKKSKPDDAQKDLEKAVSVYPKYAAAWFELGRVYEGRDHFDKARDAYQHSIAADSKYINPYERIYQIDARDSKWQQVADGTDKVLHLDPYDYPQAYYFNAVANLQLNKYDAAEKSGREAVKLDKAHQNPKAIYVLGITLAQKQEFKEAADCLHQYLALVPNDKDSDRIQKQLADIEKAAEAKAQPPK